jgi:outer membrane protein TolC
MTLPEAVALSLRNGPEVTAAKQGEEAARRRVKGTSAQRYPKVRAEANLLYWDKELVLNFDLVPAPMPMPTMMPPIVVRDQITSTISITVAQPLTGLFALNRLVAIEEIGADAARTESARARLDTAQRAAEAYLRLLQAQALEDVAKKSVQQMEAQLERARILEKAGVLGPVDVLRLTSARDSARQSLLRASTAVTVARSSLALALALPPDTAIAVVDDLPEAPPAVRANEQEGTERALRDRPEIKAAEERTAQAQGARSVAKAQLFPNVLAVGTYQHLEGQGPFQPKDAWFVGATLSWDVWDWGRNWQGVKEAEARAMQASINARALRDQVVFDVRRRLLETKAAHDMLAVARSSLVAADEAHRIQTVRYAEGAATTTDVLDAEVDVSRARSGFAQARYDYFLSQAGLARALGQSPAGTAGGTP